MTAWATSPLRRALADVPVVAILRRCPPAHTPALARAAADAGIRVIEVTLDSDRPLDQLAAVRRHVPDGIVGAGTVTTPEQLSSAVAAGAQFAVSPCFFPSLAGGASDAGVPLVAAGLTPTELAAAWEATAGLVKVFPAGVLGPDYIRAVREPFPDIPLLATGGVTPDAAPAFLAAGAVAVGLGGALFPRRAMDRGDVAEVRSHARRLTKALRPGLRLGER